MGAASNLQLLLLQKQYSTLDSATNTNAGTLSNGNLTYAATSASGNVVRSTNYTSNNFYCEYIMTTVGNSGNHACGIVISTQTTVTPTSIASVPAGMWEWRSDAVSINNGASTALGTAAANNDIIMVACSPTTGKVWFGKNGTWFSGNPALGTTPAYSNLTTSASYAFMINMFATGGSPAGTARFAPYNCTYAPPTGFVHLTY